MGGIASSLVEHDALIEVFRNPATDLEIRNSQSNLTADEIDDQRSVGDHRTNKAKGKKQTIFKEKLPWL